MYARRVGDPTPSKNVQHVMEIRSPLNRDQLLEGIKIHTDRTFYNCIKQYADHGVPVGYTGERYYSEANNWPSAVKYSEAVSQSIDKDLMKGRKSGPFSEKPFSTFRGSPLGAFPKKRSIRKYRIIHDLSWPPGRSVNTHIADHECTLHYISIDEASKLVKKYGKGAYLAKLDLEDAFKGIVVRPEDWDLLGSVWYPDGDHSNKQYYVDMVLQFGLRSSPRRFNEFADALEYIMKQDGVTDVCHYLDDYLTAGPQNTNICQINLDHMLNTCDRVGFAVNPSKIATPTTEIEFLGIIVDSVREEFRISKDRVNEILAELTQWGERHKCTKRQLLSIIGKLTFVSRVVRPGRTFIARMIQLGKRVKHLHHRITLNREFRSDISWWLTYLSTWNGVTMFHDDIWNTNDDLHLWTDASDVGFGAYFQGDWFCSEYTSSDIHDACISARELYAVVIALSTWAHKLRCKRVMIHSDNQAVVDVMKSGYSRNTLMMKMLRVLFYICANDNFECKAVHVPGCQNDLADALNRLNIDLFFRSAPRATKNMTKPKYVKLI